MLTDDDARAYIDNFMSLGDKGYVKLWRRDDALGVMVMLHQHSFTSQLKISTDWWEAYRGIVKVRTTELNAIKELLHFFKSQEVIFELPGVMTRGRFEKAFRDLVREHHDLLVDNLRNREGNERAAFKFTWSGGISKHNRTVTWLREGLKAFKAENDLPIVMKESQGEGFVMYGWSSC